MPMPLSPVGPPLEPEGLGLPTSEPSFLTATAAPPPVVPEAPHTFMPSFGAPQRPQSKTPGFLQAILPAAISMLTAHGDPVVAGAGLAGIVQGRRLRQAQQENEYDRQTRERQEAAQFYTRALSDGNQFDDPVQFQQWKSGIAPMAQVYGINPDVFQFSDAKRQAKARKDAAGVVDTLRRVHGEVVDDPTWQAAHSTTVNGQPVTVADLYKLAQMPTVTDAKGQALAPPSKITALTPNTAEEQFYAQFAKENGAKSFADLPTTKQAQAREQWSKTGRAPAAVPNVGSFEDYVTRKFGPAPTPQQITQARKEYGQADDKPASSGAGEYRSFLMTDKLAKDWQTASQPVREMRRQFGLMQTGLQRFTQGDKNGGSQAVLVTFQKILDPSSVVRESEYARSAAGVSLLSRLEGYVEKLQKGGAGVPEGDLRQMVETARQMLGNMQTYAQGQRQRLERTAKQYGVMPDLIFDDVGVVPPSPGATPAPAAGGTITHRFNPATGKVETVGAR
jgi:hypothetical protein